MFELTDIELVLWIVVFNDVLMYGLEKLNCGNV